MHYNFRRYYDPEIGRYVTADPIGLAGGLNRYVYVSSDPINRFDPTGQFAFVLPVAIPVAEILIPGIGLGLGVAVGSMIWPTQPDSNDNSAGSEVRPTGDYCLPPNNPDPCDEIRRKIRDIRAKLASKERDQAADKHQLYTRAYSVNPGGELAGKGTYLGHANQIESLKIGLARRIAEAVAQGCM